VVGRISISEGNLNGRWRDSTSCAKEQSILQKAFTVNRHWWNNRFAETNKCKGRLIWVNIYGIHQHV